MLTTTHWKLAVHYLELTLLAMLDFKGVNAAGSTALPGPFHGPTEQLYLAA